MTESTPVVSTHHLRRSRVPLTVQRRSLAKASQQPDVVHLLNIVLDELVSLKSEVLELRKQLGKTTECLHTQFD